MDYTMLPLECLYLNKTALINVVGQPVCCNYINKELFVKPIFNPSLTLIQLQLHYC